MKNKKYPSRVYSNIHPDDENSWGMCCSYEMACRCAEQHYDADKKHSIIVFIQVIVALIVGISIMIFLFIKDAEFREKYIQENAEVCGFCHERFSEDETYVKWDNEKYHVQCFKDKIVIE